MIYSSIYTLIKRIPVGKVVTYGQIAKLTQNLKFKTKNGKTIKVTPRLVGNILHRNPDPKDIPCHRVVSSKGKLAENFAFGGWRQQKRKLEEERVTFLSERVVNLNKHLFKYKA